MVNKPKAKGTAAESAVVSYLRTAGFPMCERLALQGGKDRGDVTGIPGIVVEVKAENVYTLSSWLQECRVEVENAKADFGFVAAKPRGVGNTRTDQWYAVMNLKPWQLLLDEASKECPGCVRVWMQDMRPGFINRDLAGALKLAQGHQLDSGFTHSCVRIAPKGVEDPSMYYVVTTLAQMGDLLVRAGYGRRDDPAGT
jgi:hypothetical protein